MVNLQAFDQQQQSGTTIQFDAPLGEDLRRLKYGRYRPIVTKFQCITAMTEYENQSLEELRIQDYIANRKGKQQSRAAITPAQSRATIRFNPPLGQDTMCKNGVTENIITIHQSITTMEEYNNQSLEELRLEHSSVRGASAGGFTSPVVAAQSTGSTVGPTASGVTGAGAGGLTSPVVAAQSTSCTVGPTASGVTGASGFTSSAVGPTASTSSTFSPTASGAKSRASTAFWTCAEAERKRQFEEKLNVVRLNHRMRKYLEKFSKSKMYELKQIVRKKKYLHLHRLMVEKFAQLLHPDALREILEKLLNGNKTRKWRFRLQLTEHLIFISQFCSSRTISEYLLPIAIKLAHDKMATVRIGSHHLLSVLLKMICHSDYLVEQLVCQLIKNLLYKRNWKLRQSYVQLCQAIIAEEAVTPAQFAKYFLHLLLILKNDPVPNVRISLAKCIASYMEREAYRSYVDHLYQIELEETVKQLQSDSDRDVCYFCSATPAWTKSSFIDLGAAVIVLPFTALGAAGAKLPSTESEVSGTELPSIESQASGAKLPSIESEVSGAKLPSIESELSGGELPSIESEVSGAELPSIESEMAVVKLPLTKLKEAMSELQSTQMEEAVHIAEPPSTELEGVATKLPSTELEAVVAVQLLRDSEVIMEQPSIAMEETVAELTSIKLHVAEAELLSTELEKVVPEISSKQLIIVETELLSMEMEKDVAELLSTELEKVLAEITSKHLNMVETELSFTELTVVKAVISPTELEKVMNEWDIDRAIDLFLYIHSSQYGTTALNTTSGILDAMCSQIN